MSVGYKKQNPAGADLQSVPIKEKEKHGLQTRASGEKVVGKTSFDDCLHIALATIHKADYLISWNFKHIVNVERIRGYNSVNMKLGFSTIDIRSPREFMKYENE